METPGLEQTTTPQGASPQGASPQGASPVFEGSPTSHDEDDNVTVDEEDQLVGALPTIDLGGGNTHHKEPTGTAGLDETITDPLKEVEREVLTKIRKHEKDVGALRCDVAVLCAKDTGSTSIAELRRITDEADRLERLLKLPREILARDSLAQTEWPAEDLMQARAVLARVDACEVALSQARKQLSDDEDCTPRSVGEALQQLVSSWYTLRSAERSARAGTALAVKRVDLAVDAQAVTVSPLVDALLDKAVEMHSKLSLKVKQTGSDPESTITDNGVVDLAVFTERFRAFFQNDWVKEALEALHVEVPSSELFADRPEPQREEAAPAPTAEAPAAEAEKEAAEKAAPRQAEPAEDPLLQTVPGVPGLPLGSSTAALGTMPVGLGGMGTRQLMAQGPPDLWHAVHIGDRPAVEAFINGNLCNAQMRDASGHSVLWHSVAFGHIHIANLMLDAFPPGTEKGCDIAEIHQRKGDTLLHLLCQSKTFGTQLAHIFKRIAACSPPSLFQKVNRAGLTFFQLAASGMNFWVLTFILRNFHAQAKALVCMPSNAPMKNLAEVIAQPLPPEFATPVPFPDHFRVAELLQQDDFGSVPYADIAFDVGPDKHDVAAGRFLAHRIVIATQSPVLFEAFEKLPLTELAKDGPKAAVFRVDPRISQEAWRTALQFMYTGVINCNFTSNVDKVIELLRACTMYKLPKPLLDFAQASLYPLLPASPPHVSLQAFSICAGSAAGDADLRPIREASVYIILRSAHRLFENMEPKETTQILERVVQTVEHSVFNPRKNTAPQQAPPPSRQLQESQDAMTQSMRRLPMEQQQQQQQHQQPPPSQHDMMSQSLLGVWRQEAGYPQQHAYGRPAMGPLGSMQIGTMPLQASMGTRQLEAGGW